VPPERFISPLDPDPPAPGLLPPVAEQNAPNEDVAPTPPTVTATVPPGVKPVMYLIETPPPPPPVELLEEAFPPPPTAVAFTAVIPAGTVKVPLDVNTWPLVPRDKAEEAHVVPLDVNTFPLVPTDDKPVPPCDTERGVVSPVKDVMSEFAPKTAALKLTLAAAALLAPVPPSATAKSVIPVMVPLVIVTLLIETALAVAFIILPPVIETLASASEPFPIPLIAFDTVVKLVSN
jgi:hypothetical protein